MTKEERIKAFRAKAFAMTKEERDALHEENRARNRAALLPVFIANAKAGKELVSDR